MKNVGVNPIGFVDKVDVYYGPITNLERMPYDLVQNDLTWQYATPPGPPTPVWDELETFAINITDNNIQRGETYHVTVSTPNGVIDEHIFSIP